MKVSEAFPSKYLSASDLADGNLRLVMKSVEMEKIGDDTKPVLYFRGQAKGLALNKTNGKTIADAYGDETDDWTGHDLILFPVTTEFQGKPVEAIRVRAPQPKDNVRPAARPQRQAPPDDDFPGDVPPARSQDDYRA